MKAQLLVAALAALALPMLAACANPSHEADADDLRDRLAGLHGGRATGEGPRSRLHDGDTF